MAKKWFIAGKSASVASEETWATAEEAEKALETGKYKQALNGVFNAPAGTTTEPSFATFEEHIKYMEETTEQVFEISIKIKYRNVFWLMYLTDKLSDNWGFTVMLLDWTLINLIRPSKWWRIKQGKCQT